MTPEEKYSLHYPYKVMCDNWDKPLNARQLDLMASHGHGFERYKLYLRSFDQLKKECVQADYNDGKPFVPVEWFENENNCEIDYFADNPQVKMLFNDGNICDLELLPFGLVKQLLKWHFQVGFEDGEFIKVDEQNNPY